MPSQPRYTREQALAGLRCFLKEDFGVTAEFDESTPLHGYFNDHVSGGSWDPDPICPLEVLSDASEYFGFRWGEQRWTAWLRVGGSKKLRSPTLNRHERRRLEKEEWTAWLRDVSPTLTFGRLADTIAREAPAPSFAPITVFGNHCAPAGVFTGLRSLPELRGKRVAPSTRLVDALGPIRVRDFLNRAGWMTGVEQPKCREYRLIGFGAVDQTLATLLVLVITLVAWVVLGHALGKIEVFGFLLWLAGWIGAALVAHDRLLSQIGNPLPQEMQTFADLSRWIVSRRPGEAP